MYDYESRMIMHDKLFRRFARPMLRDAWISGLNSLFRVHRRESENVYPRAREMTVRNEIAEQRTSRSDEFRIALRSSRRRWPVGFPVSVEIGSASVRGDDQLLEPEFEPRVDGRRRARLRATVGKTDDCPGPRDSRPAAEPVTRL